jgi:hypothetical protein
MKTMPVVFVMLCAALLRAGPAETGKPLILLCTGDSARTHGTKGKLVYGYIDGKRTSCMSERELLALYSLQELPPPDTTGKRYVRANLKGYDLAGANFSDQDLTASILDGADLRQANLANAVLERASLKAAYLRRANLKGADLTDARIDGAYLNGADLTDAKGVTLQMLRTAYNCYKLKADSSLLRELADCCPALMRDPGSRWDTNQWKPADKELKAKFDQ